MHASSPSVSWRVNLLIVYGVYMLWHACVGWFADFPLYGDEAQYWVWGKNPDFGYYSKPPLIGWILGVVTSLLGDSPFVVRLPALIAHLITAHGLYTFATDNKHPPSDAALVSLAYLSMPGVSFSSHIISTDPVLLACWAWAMVWGYRFVRAPSATSATWFGVVLGVGFLAKYAMIWFVLMLPVALWFVRSRVDLGKVSRYIPRVVMLVAVLVSPNVYWNYSHAWPTFTHTANNIGGWKGLNLPNALIFIVTQIGILGPVLAIRGLMPARRLSRHEDIRFALGMSLPVFGFILVQALVNRSHGNWAAIAHVGVVYACVLGLLSNRRWLWQAIGLNMALGVLMGVASVLARYDTLPQQINPYQRFYRATRILQAFAAQNISPHDKVIVCDDRQLVAQLMYQLRDSKAIVVRYNPDSEPLDYFGMNTDMRVAPERARVFIGPTCLAQKQRPDMGVRVRESALVLGKPFKPLCLQEYQPQDHPMPGNR